MNEFKLIGTVFYEPKLYGSGEKTVCKALIKVEKNVLNVVAFSENSRVLHSYSKDEPIQIFGHVRSGSYEKDGKKIYTQDLVIDKFGDKKGSFNDDIEEWLK
jgi:hypothetical protein